MNGIFFDLRTLRALDLGAIFGKILGDGKVRGCTLSYSGANLTIAKGHMVAKGRLIAFDNAETIASETTAANGYGRLKLSIDLSQAASGISFAQALFSWDYAATNSFPALTQNDINDGTNTAYQVEICRVSFYNSTISGIVSQLGDAEVKSAGAQPAHRMFTNVSVATSAWLSDSTYTDFPYRAAVACTGVTAAMFAEVVLSPADALSGNIAPVCQTYSGGVYLYAKAVPSAAVTIPTIIVWG